MTGSGKPAPDLAARARAVALYGTEQPPEPRLRLVAGQLTADLESGNLRALRWGGFEVLRAIAFVIRDTHWGTYAPEIRDLEVDQRPDRFTVSYSAGCGGAEGRFEYRASIVGSAEGRLRFEATGSTPTGFETNRTGFVVLHGLDGVAGRPLHIRHASGGTSETIFPEAVKPDQPVFDIAELRHEPVAGLRVSVAFEGDAFEMEDHRNWTDASFKTYVRPLARGYPYRIEPGETLRQAVELRVEGVAPASAQARTGPVRVQWGSPEAGPAPRIGLFVDRDSLDDARRLKTGIAALRPNYLQLRLDLRSEDGPETLAGFAGLARALACPVHLDVVIPGVSPESELSGLPASLGRAGLRPEWLFVIPARDLASRRPNHVPDGEAAPDTILAIARKLLPGPRIGGGMPVGFPELNRNRPPPDVDFVTHATQAIVHAADDLSVMETLEAVPHVIRTTRSFAGAIPYRLGPATIGMPASSSASAPVANDANRRMPLALNDPRQRGLFGAAFMIGYAAAAPDVAALTLAAPTGPIGLLHTDQSWPTPGFSEDGIRYPVAETFAGLAAIGGGPRIRASHDAPGRLAAVAGTTENGPVLWLANLTPEPVEVSVEGQVGSLRLMDAERLGGSSGPAVNLASLRLDPYAVACLSAQE